MPLSFMVFIVVLSVLPAIIWFLVIHKLRNISINKALLTFGGGMLAILPILLMKYLFNPQPDFDFMLVKGNIQIFDFFKAVEASFENATMALFAGFVLVGIIEEYLKHYVVKKIDSKDKSFATIADAIGFAAFAALGFAFLENIFYAMTAAQEFGVLRHWEQLSFFHFLMQPEALTLILIIFLRSVLSTCAHILFASIYGYYYGLHKFAKEEMIEKIGQGHQFRITHWISKVTRIPLVKIFSGEMLMEGLFLAMLVHAAYNFFMASGFAILAVVLVIIGFIGVMYELQTRANLMNLRIIDEEINLAKKMHEIDEEKKHIKEQGGQ
ncbi:MAG: PrsW family glutamic-type intramembrane protease [Patescibacteria group bacterium]|nr:PrsW family glutamic-type intramembrane protease [Patescibacteria group bacterium]